MQDMTASMTSQLTSLQKAFSNQGVKLEIRIGETRMAHTGFAERPANAFLAKATNAQ